MKRFQSILCAALLTLAMSSVSLAGTITGRAGTITGRPGTITGEQGTITGLTDGGYDIIVDLLTAALG